MDSLLHPDYFNGIPLVGMEIEKRMRHLESDTKLSKSALDGVTVAIRTLNEANRLEGLLEDVKRQDLDGDIEVVVVDNESSDHTVDVARKFGAQLITLPRSEFTYPKSMNLAVDAASHELVFLTVGHARLVSTQSLQAGINALHTEETVVGGAYGHALPNHNASRTENIIAIGNINFTRRQRVNKVGFGTMAATGCMLRKSIWHELGRFDESFERGGEDNKLAKKMLQHGYALIDEPLLSTHHTHGLNFKDTAKQWVEWSKMQKPSTLDKERLKIRRPDLDLDS